MRITALIADDEAPSRRLLREALAATGKVEVIAEAANGSECLMLLEDHDPDVLFLDIEMGAPDGIEVAQFVVEQGDRPFLVFVTGHQSYAVKAFELAAVDYVVKEADLEEFEKRIGTTVDRVERAIGGAEEPERLEVVRDMLERITRDRVPPTPAKLPVKDYDQGTVRLLDPSSIICVRRRDRRVVIHTRDEEFPTYFTIQRLAERLAGGRFFQANPSAIINLDYVEHLIPNGDGSYDALLKAGEQTIPITVSRSRARELFDALGPV